MSKFNAFVFVALCLVAVGAQNVTYTIPLTPAANDTLTFQRVARSNLFNMLQVEITLAPCAVRLAHYHAAADELILVISGQLGFVNVEANNTAISNIVGPGTVIEQPKAGVHAVWNPTCNTTYYTNVFNAASPVTYNLPYALPQVGNFTTEATYISPQSLRFPGIVPAGQWVYNPSCLRTCNITLPPNLVDASATATGATG